MLEQTVVEDIQWSCQSSDGGVHFYLALSVEGSTEENKYATKLCPKRLPLTLSNTHSSP